MGSDQDSTHPDGRFARLGLRAYVPPRAASHTAGIAQLLPVLDVQGAAPAGFAPALSFAFFVALRGACAWNMRAAIGDVVARFIA